MFDNRNLSFSFWCCFVTHTWFLNIHVFVFVCYRNRPWAPVRSLPLLNPPPRAKQGRLDYVSVCACANRGSQTSRQSLGTESERLTVRVPRGWGATGASRGRSPAGPRRPSPAPRRTVGLRSVSRPRLPASSPPGDSSFPRSEVPLSLAPRSAPSQTRHGLTAYSVSTMILTSTTGDSYVWAGTNRYLVSSRNKRLILDIEDQSSSRSSVRWVRHWSQWINFVVYDWTPIPHGRWQDLWPLYLESLSTVKYLDPENIE